MAGSTHNYTMNIGIKVDAGGIGKTNSELKNLSNEVNGLHGKKIDLKVNLGDKASKTIDSITKSISNMEKGLNNISSKGILGIQDAVSNATKSMDSLTSAIGSVQKSLDTINAKGLQDVSSAMGDITKSSADASSGVGGLSTAIATVNIGNLEEVASMLGNIQTAAQDAGSSISQAMETSGFNDNWNNSYGGRYGGMRYTGQGMGMSDIVSAISNGKSSYELTVENAMNKTRNMAVAKSWTPEDGVSGMDAYWALDAATNHSLMSLNTLAAGINATAATTGASAKDIKGHARDFADFGTMVMGLGYTEDVAQTAVMKLGRGLHGTFAALDQYGITKESLTSTGLWNGDENDFDGYMAAVSEYSRLMSTQLLSTATGQMATLSKSASLGGYALGQIEAEATQGLAAWYQGTDDWLRRTTQKMGLGANVRDNAGQRVLYRIPKDSEGNPIDYIDYNDNGVYDEDTDEAMGESVYVTADGRIVDDMGRATKYAKEADAIADGFSQKKTGFSLSTLIIGADQVISTYKTVKDTVLGTFAELRDLRMIRKMGLRNIFSMDSNISRDSFGNFVTEGEKMANMPCPYENCPQGRNPQSIDNQKQKKNRGIFGRTKDKIGDTVTNTKNKVNDKINKVRGNQKDFSILNPSPSSGNKSMFGKIKDKIGNIGKNPYSIISNPNFEGYDKPITPKPSIKPRTQSGMEYHNLNPNRYDTHTDSMYGADGKPRKRTRYDNDRRSNRDKDRKSGNNKKYPNKHDYITKKGSSSAIFNRPYKSAEMSSTFKRWKKESEIETKAKNLNKDLDAKNKQRINSKDSRNSRITNKVSDKIGDFKNNVSSKKTGLQNYFSADNKQREAAGQQYNGYMKNVNKGLFDIKSLKTKSKQYLKTKKEAIQKEFAKGELKGLVNKRVYGDMARQAPYSALDKVTSGARTVGGAVSSRISDSALGGAYSTIRSQGSSLKNTVTGSRVWGGASRVAGTMSSQIGGNAAAMYGMATGGKDIKKTRVGKAVNSVKQNGVVKSARAAAAPVASRVGGAARTAGGAVMKGASAGVGAVASGVGKIGGLMSGIMGGLGAILGPVGMILMAVTLITGLLDAMGVDWMGPLQTAFGGFIEALQPAIQGFGTWLQETAEKVGPILTQIGQVLGPILSALGTVLGGGLSALGGVLEPILSGFLSLFGGMEGSGLFDGLADGLSGLGPIVSQLWDLMGTGASGFGGFLGGIFDGAGEYITHIIQEAANSISMFWNTIAQGISTVIQTIAQGISIAITTIVTTVGTQAAAALTVIGAGFSLMFVMMGAGIGAMLSLIGAGLGAAIAAIGIGTGASILATLGAIGVGIALIGGAIALAIAGIGAAIAYAGASIAGSITMILTAVAMGVTAMATAITSGIEMISSGVQGSFEGFAAAILLATTIGYKTLWAFQGKAVSLMGDTATDMVNAFTSNFTGVGSAVDAEMKGAYDALCYWGDLMVAKAEEIGRRMSEALVNKGMDRNSPGYIWRNVRDEFQGATGEIIQHGSHMVSAAQSVGSGVVSGYSRGYGDGYFNFTDTVTPISPPSSSDVLPVPLDFESTALPKVEMPSVAKEIKEGNNKGSDEGPATVIFNHYGDLDSEERANKVMKFIASHMGFENKRANRTVNHTQTTGA